MLTVWAWRVVQASQHSKWLLIYFPAMREGQVTIYTAVMAKPTRNITSGQPKKNAVGPEKTRNPHKNFHFAALQH